MKESNAYILGTDTQELHRLGIQHQVWADEAHKGWDTAQFNAGQTLLDLGCGPGFCTKEMAFIAGTQGKVIGVDKSESFITFLQQITSQYQLNIEAIQSDFDTMSLPAESVDGMYCRWALAWLPNPEHALKKVRDALKPGGKMVIHEYYDWSTLQTEPKKPGLSKAIAAALQSFKDSEGEIDIGRKLPFILASMGMEVTQVRLMSKLATPSDLNWQWPKTFFHSYFPRLVAMGALTQEEATIALAEMDALEEAPETTLCCPLMVEVIATKL